MMHSEGAANISFLKLEQDFPEVLRDPQTMEAPIQSAKVVS